MAENRRPPWPVLHMHGPRPFQLQRLLFPTSGQADRLHGLTTAAAQGRWRRIECRSAGSRRQAQRFLHRMMERQHPLRHCPPSARRYDPCMEGAGRTGHSCFCRVLHGLRVERQDPRKAAPTLHRRPPARCTVLHRTPFHHSFC
ncbi:hypothetical protein SEVIR_9G423050v4 [Setaria viridis]